MEVLPHDESHAHSEETSVDTRAGLADFQNRIYVFLCVAVMAQLITIGITWELWQTRSYPVHVPAFDVSQIDFGWIMIASLPF